MRIRLLAALLIGAAFLSSAAAPAPAPSYCAPVAYRDYVLPVGYQALIITPATCTKPALVRKQNSLTGSTDPPLLIRLGEPRRLWLFTHRLAYTLDGKTWKRLVVQ